MRWPRLIRPAFGLLGYRTGHSRRDDSDPCPHPLFATVDHGSEFWASDTVTTFVALLDNYVRETGRSEHVTTAERREVDAFLAACAATPHFELLLAFVKYHGRDPRCRDVDTMDDLKALLKELWFTPHVCRADLPLTNRGGDADISLMDRGDVAAAT